MVGIQFEWNTVISFVWKELILFRVAVFSLLNFIFFFYFPFVFTGGAIFQLFHTEIYLATFSISFFFCFVHLIKFIYFEIFFDCTFFFFLHIILFFSQCCQLSVCVLYSCCASVDTLNGETFNWSYLSRMYSNWKLNKRAANNVTIVKGIKGLASGVFFENLGASFLEVQYTQALYDYTFSPFFILSFTVFCALSFLFSFFFCY